MSESRDRLNNVLRDLGYDVRGDLVIVRPEWSDTRTVHREERWVAAAISLNIGAVFCHKGINLERFRKNPIVLWVHDYDGLPIAKSWREYVGSEHECVADRFFIRPQFHLDTELSREVWALINDAAEFKWELGVLPAEWDISDDGTHVTKWDVVEISAVPGEECIERIRQRIKNRMISSPAMLWSVAAEPKKAEPSKEERGLEHSMEIKGPYWYGWDSGTYVSTTWTVYGPGFERKVECKEDAGARVDELNDAWRRGHDYVVGDVQEPPSPDESESVGLDERVAELEKWRRKINEKFAAGPRIIDSQR